MFFRLIKRFFLIFGSQVDRMLDDLDTVRLRSERAQKQYKQALLDIQKIREDNEENVVLYEDKVKAEQNLLSSLENSLIKASNVKASEQELNDINFAISHQEETLSVIESTLESFQTYRTQLDEQVRELREESTRAEHTLKLAVLRYDSAKKLADLNSNAIPENLRQQVASIKEDADRMDARYKGICRIKKRDPSPEATIKKYASTSVSVEDRVAKILAKNNS